MGHLAAFPVLLEGYQIFWKALFPGNGGDPTLCLCFRHSAQGNRMTISLDDLRILEPYPGVFAYYDGRIAGKRLYSELPNWLDDGAFSLGIASYAIVEGEDALVYDTHISLAHAGAIRRHVESLGATRITVVLSHFHNDHIAGNAAFADCRIIANRKTAELLKAELPRIATRLPVIDPVVMPNSLFDDRHQIRIGHRLVELIVFNIHSPDATLLWLPEEGLLFAGDTLEDTVTYVGDPASLPAHVEELKRMKGLPISHILPCHGDPARIAQGGYGPSFIDATIDYIEAMTEEVAEPSIWHKTLEEAVRAHTEHGALIYVPAYEAVHRSNVSALRAYRAKA
jgi:glyoxylase-like metal-dependent hydrolase (beta-lactamase superfamily II)